MTKEEKETKIADLKKKSQNKSLPASAVKKLEEMIAKLDNEPTEEPEPEHKTVGTYKGLDIFDKGPKEKSKFRFYMRDKPIPPYTEGPIVANGETIEKLKLDFDSNKPKSKPAKKVAPTKKEKSKLFKKARAPIPKEDIHVEGAKREDISKKDWDFIINFSRYSDKGNIILKDSKGLDTDIIVEWKVKPKKSENKASDYDCDELIQKEKDRKAAAKKVAKKADAIPTVKKVEKSAEKLGDRVQKKYKEGELTKAEIKKIIEELQQQIQELQELLKKTK